MTIPRGLLAFGLAFVAMALLPTLREPIGLPVSYLVLLGLIWFWTAQATSWNVLSGYSGYFSFGQAAFLAVGAYTTAVLVGRHGVDFFVTIPIAGALSGLLALGVGALAFRLRSLRGEIFALLTLAVPFVLESLARVNTGIDGGQGIILRLPAYPDFLGSFQDLVYLLLLAVGIGALAIAFVMQHSRYGWALFSIHDGEEVAEGLGVPTFRHKMIAIALNGMIAGIAGSVFALQIGFVTIESVFGLTVPLFVIVMCVLGGRSHWLGPLLGAAVIVTLQDRLAASGFEGWSLVILGSLLAVLVIMAPEGLYARLRRRPWPVVVAFATPIAVLAVLRPWGEPLDWILVGMGAGAIVAFAPQPRWRRRPGSERPRSCASAFGRAAARPGAAASRGLGRPQRGRGRRRRSCSRAQCVVGSRPAAIRPGHRMPRRDEAIRWRAGVAGRLVRGQAGRDRGPGRPQRLGQDDVGRAAGRLHPTRRPARSGSGTPASWACRRIGSPTWESPGPTRSLGHSRR